MYLVDGYGWPIERISGRPIRNFIRTIIFSRGARYGKWEDRSRGSSTEAHGTGASNDCMKEKDDGTD